MHYYARFPCSVYFLRTSFFPGAIAIQKKYAICKSTIEISIDIANTEAITNDSNKSLFTSVLVRLLSINLFLLAYNQIMVSNEPAAVKINAYNMNIIW